MGEPRTGFCVMMLLTGGAASGSRHPRLFTGRPYGTIGRGVLWTQSGALGWYTAFLQNAGQEAFNRWGCVWLSLTKRSRTIVAIVYSGFTGVSLCAMLENALLLSGSRASSTARFSKTTAVSRECSICHLSIHLAIDE